MPHRSARRPKSKRIVVLCPECGSRLSSVGSSAGVRRSGYVNHVRSRHPELGQRERSLLGDEIRLAEAVA